MSIALNTNINAMIGLNQLRLTDIGIKKSMDRLSTGLKVIRPYDDPIAPAISNLMDAQIGGIRTAIGNAEDTKSMVSVADGALNETSNLLLRMRDMAVRASNQATLTSSDIEKINDEIQSLKAEISRKSASISFNSKMLFSGAFSGGRTIQIGPDNATNFVITLTIGPMTLSGLTLATNGMNSVNSLWISNMSTGTTAVSLARAAIDYIDIAINTISNTRAGLGLQERRLDYIIDDLNLQSINASATKSVITDADMAVEMTNLTRLQILQQSSMAVLAQANIASNSFLKMLQ
jgi:flagellin